MSEGKDGNGRRQEMKNKARRKHRERRKKTLERKSKMSKKKKKTRISYQRVHIQKNR